MPDPFENGRPTLPEGPATADPAFAPEPKKKPSMALRIGSAILAVVLGAGAWIGTRALLDSLSGNSKQQAIEKAVDELHRSVSLPSQLDEVTILTDITAEENAVHYFYTLTDVDPSVVTTELLESVVQPTMCGTKQTRELLDRDVAMRYSYVVEGTDDSYDFELTKDNC
ncbi:MAG: hypothetical protein J0H23_11240 [Micrococcales bacterium]|nr:hypothetical protein [Micrococcales bacterium]OJX69461.1 MAG: hypothetical protein BGO94_13180 [Micrococcales bacterium 72-143]